MPQVEKKNFTSKELIENVQECSLDLKRKILEHPTPNKNLLLSIDNLLTALKSESEKEMKKENKERTSCPHTNKPKIAKGMCFYCYNKHGKTKKANKCEHTDQLLYCQGLC